MYRPDILARLEFSMSAIKTQFKYDHDIRYVNFLMGEIPSL